MFHKIKHKIGLTAICSLLVFFLATPALPIPSQYKTNPSRQFQSPDSSFLLGSDHLGRDLLSRLVWGARTTFSVTIIACIIAVLCGFIAGAIAGLADDWLSTITNMPLNIMLAFPGILLALVVVEVLGRGWLQIAFSVGLSLSPVYARIVRSAVVSMRQETYFEAARALGAGFCTLLTTHIFPKVRDSTISEIVTLGIWAINGTVAMEYLGLGDNPSESSLGRLILDGRSYVRIAPHLVIVPTTLLILVLFLLSTISTSNSLRQRNRIHAAQK